jgi:hypothetical protein
MTELYDAHGRKPYDNRTGEQRFFDALNVGHQDVTWLTEKARSVIINGDPRRRQEIDMRGARLDAMIEMVKRAHVMFGQNIVHLNKEVVTMQADVRTAIEGLRDFLTAILPMPMADETRTAIQNQRDMIEQMLQPPSASGGEPGGRPGG